MEIVTLNLVITEDDLNRLLIKFVAAPPKIGNLYLHVKSDGLSLAGIYETFLPIPFDTQWHMFVDNGKIAARCSAIRAVGIRLDFLKGYMLRALSSTSAILEVDEESLVFDVDRFLEEKAVPTKTNLTSIRCESERLVIECNEQINRHEQLS